MTAFAWTPIRYRNVISLLKKPFYAGAYAYGKSEKRVAVVDGAGAALRSTSVATRRSPSLRPTNCSRPRAAATPFAYRPTVFCRSGSAIC
jgi:hypothetical protein